MVTKTTLVWIDNILHKKIEEMIEKLKPARRNKLEVLKLIWNCIDEEKLTKKIEEIKDEEYLK